MASKHDFMAHFGVFRVISLNQCFSFSPYNSIKQKACFELFSLSFEIKRTTFFKIPQAVHRNFRNWHRLFMTDICFLPILIFLVYRLVLFSLRDQIKVRLVNSLDMVQKKQYRATLIFCLFYKPVDIFSAYCPP